MSEPDLPPTTPARGDAPTKTNGSPQPDVVARADAPTTTDAPGASDGAPERPSVTPSLRPSMPINRDFGGPSEPDALPTMPLPRASPGEAPPEDPAFTVGPIWAWLSQIVMFLFGGFMFLTPGWTFDVFIGKKPAPGAHTRLAHDLFALLGVHAISIGVLTVFALMSGSAYTRRVYARLFTFFLGTWTLVLAWNLHLHPASYGPSAKGLLVPGVLFTAANFWHGVRRYPGEAEVIPFGEVASAPTWSWLLWFLQGLTVLAAGVAILPLSGFLLHHIVRDTVQIGPVAVDQFRFTGAYAIGYAGASFAAPFMSNVRVWRPVAGLLAAWPVAIVAFALVRGDPQQFSYGAWAVFAWLLVMSAFNFAVLRAPGRPWAGDVSPRTPGWTPTDLVAGPMMGAQTARTRKRASHLYGVGMRARLKLCDAPPPGVPDNRFFTPRGESRGRELLCVARFANLTLADDAGLDVRGAAISLTDPRHGGRFDMVMNTGSTAPVRDIIDFALFVGSKFFPAWASRAVVQSDRVKREGAVVGLRRAPESFARMYYYSQIVRWWFQADDGRMYLVRYRLAPEDLGAESGLPDAVDAEHVWLRARRPGDGRAKDYLRQELRARVASGTPVRMRFQAQFHESMPDLDLQWYDATVDWPQPQHPWLDLGVLTLEDALDDEYTERLEFWPGNHPSSVGIPPSNGLRDPRSLGDSEVRVVYELQRFRRWLSGPTRVTKRDERAP